MSTRTSTVRRAIAWAGDRGTAHLAAQQDTGTWLSLCGRQIRGRDIRTIDGHGAGPHAEKLGAGFCDACRDLATAVAGTVTDGVTILLRVGAGGAGGVQLLDVPLDAVRLEPGTQIRSADAGLVHSVLEHGVLQPILLRRSDAGLVLVAGGRRLAAAALAELSTIPAVVHDMPAGEALLDALAENLHRADLDPIAQGCAYQHALQQLGLTQEALADRLGVSRPQVGNTIRLLSLPEHLREQVASGALSAAHGRALLRVTDATEQAALAAQIVADGLSTREADAAARRASAPRPGAPLPDVAQLLAALLDARVKATEGAERTRIVVDVANADVPRLLEQLRSPIAA